MGSLDDRLSALERSNRRLRGWLTALSAALGCSLLMAAAGNDDAAFDNLLVRNKIAVGGEERPAVVIQSLNGLAGISISDKDNHQKALLIYRPKTGVTALTLFDAKGNPAFEAKHLESGFDEKPVTLVNLNQPADKGGLMLASAPDNHSGVVISDESGQNRSRLDRGGASLIESKNRTTE
jgi:hypothetical protein